MSELMVPDRQQLRRWLEELGISFDQCSDCDGLHLTDIESQEGVVNSRVFIEPYGVLFTTELELRTWALVPLGAELGRLNMEYPTLKLFCDVVDEEVPILVAAAVLPTGVGIAVQQLAQFIEMGTAACLRLHEECRQVDYLYLTDAESAGPRPRGSLH